MEYVWGLMCKSFVRERQGLREEAGVRRVWQHGRIRKYATMWGSVCTVDTSTRGRHTRAGGQNGGAVLVWEGSTIHRITACEAGMSVQGGPGSQCKRAQNIRTRLGAGDEPRCA